MSKPYILVLYDSQYGTTKALAYYIAQGIEEAHMTARIRTVPKIAAQTTVYEKGAKPTIPDDGDLYVSMQDLKDCAGLALGSPCYFGNMSAAMKFFWENTVTLWLAGNLQNKPACVFTSSGTLHGGQETTLTSMMIPLLHHGMILLGLTYNEVELNRTTQGGSPYGASHVSGAKRDYLMTDDEKNLAIAQGKRLATVAYALQNLGKSL